MRTLPSSKLEQTWHHPSRQYLCDVQLMLIAVCTFIDSLPHLGCDCTSIFVSVLNCRFCMPLYSQVSLLLSWLSHFLSFSLTSVILMLCSLCHVFPLISLTFSNVTLLSFQGVIVVHESSAFPWFGSMTFMCVIHVWVVIRWISLFYSIGITLSLF